SGRWWAGTTCGRKVRRRRAGPPRPRLELAKLTGYPSGILTRRFTMPARLTDEQLAELREIDSPTIANAIEPFKVRGRVEGYVGHDVRCLIPGLGTMLGYAVTCKGDSTTEGRVVERAHQQLYGAIYSSPKPAIVVIQDDGQDNVHSCHAGEMMATTMKRCGAIGIVSDGGLRDIHEIRALGGFHYYGAGLVVAHGNPLIYDVGAEVTISG